MAYKITKKAFTEAVEHCNGTRSNVAERLDVTPSAITQFLNRNPDMIELLEKKRLSMVDRAEAEIFSQLEFNSYDKDPSSAARIRQAASQFILKNLGKSKGWVEKQQVEHSGEVDSKIEVIIPKEVSKLLNGN